MKRLPMLLGFMALPGKALRILKRTRSEVGIWTRRWAADALGWTEGGAPALRQRDGLTPFLLSLRGPEPIHVGMPSNSRGEGPWQSHLRGDCHAFPRSPRDGSQ